MTHTPRTRIVNIEERLHKRMRGGPAVRYMAIDSSDALDQLSPTELEELSAIVERVNTRVTEMVVEHGSWILRRDSPRNDALAVLTEFELERAEILLTRLHDLDGDGPQAA